MVSISVSVVSVSVSEPMVSISVSVVSVSVSEPVTVVRVGVGLWLRLPLGDDVSGEAVVETEAVSEPGVVEAVAVVEGGGHRDGMVSHLCGDLCWLLHDTLDHGGPVDGGGGRQRVAVVGEGSREGSNNNLGVGLGRDGGHQQQGDQNCVHPLVVAVFH